MSTYGYIKHDEMSDYAIAHHGIKGQKWGVRRYQNPDGSLTAEGKVRYGGGQITKEKLLNKNFSDKDKLNFLKSINGGDYEHGVQSSSFKEIKGQKEPVSIEFYDGSHFNDKEVNKNPEKTEDYFKRNKVYDKASKFYDRVNKDFLDNLILKTPDGKKDLKNLIKYYKISDINEGNSHEFTIEADIDSNGPAPAAFVFDGKTLKFKDSYWI